ncbi:glycoside hydrolase superfamily [Suillus subluteus]|nr:glycoside hydrolase superfamily [Suillus subluteus]
MGCRYWGQNSYGADTVIDTFPVAFLDEFYSTGNLPSINLGNADDPIFPGTNLLNCSFLASSIEFCQAAGKIVTMSLGGATGSIGFTNDSEATAYAQTIWDLFLGGSSSIRPFGIDMDIEGGSQTGFVSFLSALRTLMDAPQCPYPDAYIVSASHTLLDNNYCELTNYNDSNDWDFSTWYRTTGQETVSPNPNVKVYIGAPASTSAAGSGYQTMAQYSSFGGVMLWDASQAYANSRYDVSVKDALLGSVSAPPPTTTTVPTTTTTTALTTTTTSTSTTSSPSPTTTSGTGSCTGVAAWQTGVAYVGGDEVTYGGDLWTANWWSENDIPDGK